MLKGFKRLGIESTNLFAVAGFTGGSWVTAFCKKTSNSFEVSFSIDANCFSFNAIFILKSNENFSEEKFSLTEVVETIEIKDELAVVSDIGRSKKSLDKASWGVTISKGVAMLELSLVVRFF
jgi:hypothetical protein